MCARQGKTGLLFLSNKKDKTVAKALQGEEERDQHYKKGKSGFETLKDCPSSKASVSYQVGEITQQISCQLPWIQLCRTQVGWIRIMEVQCRHGHPDGAHIPGGRIRRDRSSGQKTKSKKVLTAGADGRICSLERALICGSRDEIASDHIGLFGLVGKAHIGNPEFGIIWDTHTEGITNLSLYLGLSARLGRSTTLEPANTKGQGKGPGAM